jgi:serine/threonine-protein phosphatase 5
MSDTESVGSRTDGPSETKTEEVVVVWDEEEQKKAEEFKTQGNAFFTQNKHPQAIDMYTEAIFCKVPPAKKAIYYCNRAFAHYRMESYAICVFDGCEAIKLDPSNIKGYFRRGQGYAMQRQLKNAVADFKTICKMQPANKEAREKYEHTQKEYRLQMLAQAIVSDDARVSVKVDEMLVEASYKGPALESADDVTPEWCASLMEWQKGQKRLHRKFATMII